MKHYISFSMLVSKEYGELISFIDPHKSHIEAGILAESGIKVKNIAQVQQIKKVTNI